MSALERRPRVWSLGRGSFSPVVTFHMSRGLQWSSGYPLHMCVVLHMYSTCVYACSYSGFSLQSNSLGAAVDAHLQGWVVGSSPIDV